MRICAGLAFTNTWKMAAPAGKGFYDLLLKPDEDHEKYVNRVESIHVIAGSVPSSNPVPALASPKARALFERLKQKFAFVIVDAPPILPIADSHTFGTASGRRGDDIGANTATMDFAISRRRVG